MSDKKTVNVGLRLTDDFVKALERYRVDKEQEVRQLASGYNMSLSASARALIENSLVAGGYIDTPTPKQPLKPLVTQSEPRTIKSRSTDTVKFREGTKLDRIRQDIINGYVGSRADLARKHDCNQSQVTKAYKQVEDMQGE